MVGTSKKGGKTSGGGGGDEGSDEFVYVEAPEDVHPPSAPSATTPVNNTLSNDDLEANAAAAAASAAVALLANASSAASRNLHHASTSGSFSYNTDDSTEKIDNYVAIDTLSTHQSHSTHQEDHNNNNKVDSFGLFGVSTNNSTQDHDDDLVDDEPVVVLSHHHNNNHSSESAASSSNDEDGGDPDVIFDQRDYFLDEDDGIHGSGKYKNRFQRLQHRLRVRARKYNRQSKDIFNRIFGRRIVRHMDDIIDNIDNPFNRWILKLFCMIVAIIVAYTVVIRPVFKLASPAVDQFMTNHGWYFNGQRPFRASICNDPAIFDIDSMNYDMYVSKYSGGCPGTCYDADRGILVPSSIEFDDGCYTNWCDDSSSYNSIYEKWMNDYNRNSSNYDEEESDSSDEDMEYNYTVGDTIYQTMKSCDYSTFKHTCSYNGWYYHPGEIVPHASKDSCNTCRCKKFRKNVNGDDYHDQDENYDYKVECTRRNCNTCLYQGKVYKHDDGFYNGCGSFYCTCDGSTGQVSCTNFIQEITKSGYKQGGNYGVAKATKQRGTCILDYSSSNSYNNNAAAAGDDGYYNMNNNTDEGYDGYGGDDYDYYHDDDNNINDQEAGQEEGAEAQDNDNNDGGGDGGRQRTRDLEEDDDDSNYKTFCTWQQELYEANTCFKPTTKNYDNNNKNNNLNICSCMGNGQVVCTDCDNY